MLRRLGREDLASVNPFLSERESHAPFVWHVYEDYEQVDPGEEELPYIRAVTPKGYESPKRVRSYNPLVDTPHLFLDFARIAERKNRRKVLSQWIRQYGLLGFADSSPQWSDDAEPEVTIPPRIYDDSGGPGETIVALWDKVYITNRILALYEAVMNRDRDKLETLIFTPEPGFGWGFEKRLQHVSGYADKTSSYPIDALVSVALLEVRDFIGDVDVFAFPVISPTGDLNQQSLLTVERLQASWGVRNVLGAMYLQFFWLVTSAGELARCKYCGRIISYAPPVQVGDVHNVRKPRNDKEFCDSRCRQNYHYHNRIKPARSPT